MAEMPVAIGFGRGRSFEMLVLTVGILVSGALSSVILAVMECSGNLFGENLPGEVSVGRA